LALNLSSRVSARKKLMGLKKKKKFFVFLKSGNNRLMSFKHLKLLNSASKCLKITLKVIKFSKPEEKKSKKTQLMGVVKFMLGVNPPHPPTV
jgi:hypothetical protein